MDLPTPSDADAERLGRVVKALLVGDELAAESDLAPIAGVTLERQPLERMPMLPRSGWPTGTGPSTHNPSLSVIAQVYDRDSFMCSYCSRKTVLLGVMRLVSRRFPDAFPFHANWKKSVAHRAYWDISTSVDHVVPVSRGGDWDAIANLTTACARCQYQKANLELAVLGWERRPAPQPEWDGLAGKYRRLWDLLGRPPGNHRAWIAAVENATSARDAI